MLVDKKDAVSLEQLAREIMEHELAMVHNQPDLYAYLHDEFQKMLDNPTGFTEQEVADLTLSAQECISNFVM